MVTGMGATGERGRWLFLLAGDWTWWAWGLTTALLFVGLLGYTDAFLLAIGATAGQAAVLLVRERKLSAFPVQLRLAYLLLLMVAFPPPLRWLYWVPAVGTLALVVFGYCLLARVLSLFPWNRREPLSADLLRRTFLSRPRLPARPARGAGCAGGLCTIEAQVGRPGPEVAGNAVVPAVPPS